MELSMVQVEVLTARMEAAKSALRYFAEIKPIKSTNNPLAMTTEQDKTNLAKYRTDARNGVSEHSIAQTIEDATFYGVGNCDEKARICYASLRSNPRLTTPVTVNPVGDVGVGHEVSLCTSVGYDHAFVVVATERVTRPVKLSALSLTTMIVDGWTEDWYFPHLPWTSAVSLGLSNLPNPRQLYVRHQIAAHEFEEYAGSLGMPAEVSQGIRVRRA